MNETQKIGLDCAFGVPSVSYFLSGFTRLGFIPVFSIPILCCVLILRMYWNNIINLMDKAPKDIRPNCLQLVSIYPIASILSLIATVIPRAYFFCDSMSHIAFMVISYQLYRLMMMYVEGESRFISMSDKEAFTLKAPPLCCCFPLERTPITKGKFTFLRFLVLQMPFAHIIIFLILNIIYSESTEIFDKVILYFIPFIAITVLGGIWGFNLTVRMIAPYYQHLRLPGKYFSFQCVLFFCKIQPIFLNLVMNHYITTCAGPFTIIVKRHTIIQIIVQIELFLLSSWATSLYKDPVPEPIV